MPMGKIAVLSFLMGDCQQGFPQVRLEIRDDNQRLLGAFIGKLPPAPHIPELYLTWQSRYRLMGSRFRELEKKSGVVTNFSSCDLEVDSNALKQQLNDWLKLPEFFPIMQGLLMKVRQDEEVRVIIQTEDSDLRRLPWHLWDFFDYHLNAEVALSSFVCQRINSPKTRNKVRILAIIGDSTGIKLERDQRELEEKLPEAEVVFVREPEAKEVSEAIRDVQGQGWDILFFAGHSISEPDATTGKLFIKDGKSLEIADLKLTLRKAIARGLKLAIFNSCDGLGIAKQLADLNMPQVIVMREPVPDMVAQEFLKYFLEAFAGGESLYLAVREARERLESVQREFPCATWLPVICQNPAEEPVSWRELVGTDSTMNQTSDEQQEQNTNAEPSRRRWARIANQGLSSARQIATRGWAGVQLVDDLLNVTQSAVFQNTEGENNDKSPPE
jgi:CHAT domain